LAEHGGLTGTPDEHRLQATLARPQQLLAYGNPTPSIFELAAAYSFGLARNHCFPDGNKRVALAAADIFLQINGHELTAPEPEAVMIILEVAEGGLSQEELAQWIAINSAPFVD
jgi:death-on-curing protein